MKLADYLSDQSLTQAAFAETIGSNQQSVARWCRGTVPQPEWLRKISEATGGAVGWEDFNPLDKPASASKAKEAA